jgi:hypothetical protein
MPKLGQYKDILKTVVFLYENVEDARAGANIGGTGFLVSVPSVRFPNQVRHTHVVTNWHVAVSGAPSCPVVRINTKSGQAETIDFDPSEWLFIPGGPDIAVSPPFEWKNEVYDATPFDGHTWLLTDEEEARQDVGPADDVFMIGRFIDYEGEETNTPALRFGHISIMDAKIKQSTGYKGRSIVIDMHSRTGFSGSPVIIYRTMGSLFINPPPSPGMVLQGGGHYISLLGIHWGQFPEEWELKKPETVHVVRNAPLIKRGEYVEGLSGMSCVIPAFDIINVLLTPELVKMREKFEDERMNIIRRLPGVPK